MKIAELVYEEQKDGKVKVVDFKNVASFIEVKKVVGNEGVRQYQKSPPYFLKILPDSILLHFTLKNFSKYFRNNLNKITKKSVKKARVIGDNEYVLMLSRGDVLTQDGFTEVVKLMRKAGDRLTAIRKELEQAKLKIVKI